MRPSITCSRLNAASVGANNLGARLENGLERSVLTVPGCNATTTDFGRRRACSIAIVLKSMFSAAFEARYAAPCHDESLRLLEKKYEYAAPRRLDKDDR